MTATNTDAAYIDFETLKTTPPTVALIGILVDQGGAQHFEQVILDERLHRAAVARQNVRAGSLEETVIGLVNAALPLVGWSFSIAMSSSNQNWRALSNPRGARGAPNALTSAKTWRTKVHPDIRDRDRGRQLSYPHARPVHTARTVSRRRQLELRATCEMDSPHGAATRVEEALPASYDGSEAGLAPVAAFQPPRLLRPAPRPLEGFVQLQKWREYRRTTYCVNRESAPPLCFQVRYKDPGLDALLNRFGVTRWAFLTGWNPASQNCHPRRTTAGRKS